MNDFDCLSLIRLSLIRLSLIRLSLIRDYLWSICG